MLPPVCFSCGRLLADLQLVYEEELKKIDKSNDEDKIKFERKKKILDKFKLNLYCCRMRLLTYVNIVELIN